MPVTGLASQPWAGHSNVMTKNDLLNRLKGMPKQGWTVSYERGVMLSTGNRGTVETYRLRGSPVYSMAVDYKAGGRCIAKWLYD